MADATLAQTVAAIQELVAASPTKALPKRTDVVAKLALHKNGGGTIEPLSLDMAIYGEATSYVRQLLNEAKAPVIAKTLDSSLLDLFIRRSSDKPMYRYDKALMQLIKTSQGYQPPQERMIQKLVTAMSQCEHQHVLDTSHARALTVRAFLQMKTEDQMATVNALWDHCTVGVDYGTSSEAMHEPDNDVQMGGVSQLPSSIHPKSRSGEVKEFVRGRAGRPFRTIKIGFRCEGSFDRKKGEGRPKLQSHIDRILKNGMVPQVTLDFLMMDNGKDIAGTTVAINTQRARLNIEQRDLWNESGVCVARSFFGGTAFPLRDHDGEALLWAIDVEGLSGYDTEGWQLANRAAGSGPWRPGEKCFAKIPAPKVLGYIIINKLGDGGSGWKFSVPPNTKWQALGASGGFPTPGQVKYMEDELAAWAGVTAAVPTDFDFQQ